MQINGTDNTFILFRCEENLAYFYELQKLRTSEKAMICLVACALPVSRCTVPIESDRPIVFINSIIFKRLDVILKLKELGQFRCTFAV